MEARVIARLEELILGIGPLKVAEAVFRILGQRFDSGQQRYHVTRRVGSSMHLSSVPNVPTTLILQLCAKHATCPARGLPTSEIAKVIELARLYGAVLDVQPHSTFESLWHDRDSVLRFLQELVIYDAMYTLVQWPPRAVPMILEAVFSWVVADPNAGKINWSISDAVAVTRSILQQTCDSRGPCALTANDIHRGAPSVAMPFTHLLEDLAHEPANVNSGYRVGHRHTDITFHTKPLIRDGDQFLVLDSCWCAPAFFEVLADQARSHGLSNVDEQIGDAFESLVRKLLTERSISHAHGKYRVGAIQGQCDAVVETNTSIIFIEVKKKALTSRAKAGNILALLVDQPGACFTRNRKPHSTSCCF